MIYMNIRLGIPFIRKRVVIVLLHAQLELDIARDEQDPTWASIYATEAEHKINRVKPIIRWLPLDKKVKESVDVSLTNVLNFIERKDYDAAYGEIFKASHAVAVNKPVGVI